MKSAVLGANGQIRRLLVRELASGGADAVAVARTWKGQPFGPAVEHRAVGATQPEQLAAALNGYPTVYSLPGPPWE